MWERNQLSLERVPLSWQEALCLTQTHLEASSSLEWWEEPYGQRTEAQQGQQGLQLMQIL